MKFIEHGYGTELSNDSIVAVFGNKNLTIEMAMDLYNLKELRFLKQIHSDVVIESQATKGCEADAHYTKEKNIGLGIYTADCIPALMWNHHKSLILACHAGWRGVQKKIIENSILKLFENNCPSNDIRTAIGPHIKIENFEVGTDIAEQLVKASYFKKSEITRSHPAKEKLYVDLEKIALSQIQFHNIHSNNIWISPIDTYSSDSHHSYRRDKVARRLISFIALK